MFDRKDIAKACGHAAYQRGLNYWKSGKVICIDQKENEEGRVILSLVDGSRDNVYTQSIEFIMPEDYGVIIDGDCSCPVEYNCKHVAAVLLQLLDEGGIDEPFAQDSTETWLEKLKAATKNPYQTETEKYDHSPFRLLYVLQPFSGIGLHGGLLVRPQKVRLLKKGGYGKPSSYSLHQVRYEFNTSSFIQESDRVIARVLTSGAASSFLGYGYSHEESYNLEQDFGELALRKMLATGRCHWIDTDTPPLTLSTLREISFTWEQAEGGQQLVWKTTPPTEQVIRLERLWYFDTRQLECGRLEHPGLLPEQAALLLEAPVIPDSELDQVSRKLILDLPEYRLPTPVEVDIKRVDIRDQTPIIHLCLQSQEAVAEATGGRRFHCARLAFEYGGIMLEAPNNPSTITQSAKGDTVYRIERDMTSEHAATETLSHLGLQPLRYPPDGDRRVWLWSAESAAQSATQWHEFIVHEIPQLREQGWQVEIDESFHLRFFEATEWEAELESEGTDWFSLSLGVDLYGKKINLLPLLIDILSQAGDADSLREELKACAYVMAPVEEHRWLKLPSERLLPIFDTLIELYDKEPLNSEGRLELSRLQGIQIGDLLNDPSLTWHGADKLQQLHQRLSDFEGIQEVSAPEEFTTELRPYQQQGLSWIQFLREFEFNGILADDMGLGKTVQALAHLLLEKKSGRMTQPSLVIAPTSLMGNWRRESNRFAPKLKVLVLHGPDRRTHFNQILEHDIVLTTYPLLRRDKKQLLEHAFHYIILDEAQAIKNPKSQTAQVVYQLKTAHRLCLTGTPMENHLGELWSIFHFLMPGFLGNLERFNRLFRHPIEHGNNNVRREQLQRRLKPFLLRRTKAAVAAELPEKTEIIRSVTLEGKQRDLYESIRLAMDRKVQKEISKKGLARSHIMILDALLKLRQVCCDPHLLSLPQAKQVQESAKLDLLMIMLPEMVEEGRKILLFSQFTKMLGLIEEKLRKQGIKYVKLTGQTRKRDEVITEFQEGNTPIFLISLKAGGVGLNLTAADTVIHYDPWWNPAVEDQATDRAHRIGQDKAVFVYKLITEETVEDRILDLQKSKKALAESIYSGKGKGAAITADELAELFKP